MKSQASERHRECFDALAAVLVQFGMAGKFEVYLTHRHFRLEAGEVLKIRFEAGSDTWALVPELRHRGAPNNSFGAPSYLTCTSLQHVT